MTNRTRQKPDTSDTAPVFPPGYMLTSMHKIGFHRDKLDAYLNGKNIFPVTLELDLTSRCTRTCPECPSAVSSNHYSLDAGFVDRLFGVLQGQTTGLLLTGGEPTMSPIFAGVLEKASKNGFEEIAVVTNGSQLGDPVVVNSLLEHAATIRLSMYDWERGSSQWLTDTLRRIGILRDHIDRSGSGLKIGASVLTSESRVNNLNRLVQLLHNAGAHWVYFHPLCLKWGIGTPELSKQNGIFNSFNSLQNNNNNGFRVFFLKERYEQSTLQFKGYHTAQFLLVIGADGMNYLAPEVKYQSGYVIGDLKDSLEEGFLWTEKRQHWINSVESCSYGAIRARHRGVLYNHFINQLVQNHISAQRILHHESTTKFLFPHIL